MAPSVPTTEPTRLTQGDTHVWSRSIPDYLSTDGWVLTYYWITLDGTVEVTLAGVADGSGGWDVTIDAAKAAEFTAVTTYLWRAVLTKAATSETVTADRGRLEILDPLTGAGERRLWLERMVDALEAKAEGRASTQQLSYSVEGRSLSLMSLEEVLDVRARLNAELEAVLAAEARENGEQATNRTRVRLWG